MKVSHSKLPTFERIAWFCFNERLDFLPCKLCYFACHHRSNTTELLERKCTEKGPIYTLPLGQKAVFTSIPDETGSREPR